MKLYCVRHGEANSIEVDPNRALSKKGTADVEKLADYLAPHRLTIPHLMHSSLTRAQQTAAILAQKLDVEEVTECAALLDESADVQPLIDMIPAWTEDTMLVGHLPVMMQLISALVVGDANYVPIVRCPPGTIVCLDYYESQRWVVDWILSPGIVSALSEQ